MSDPSEWSTPVTRRTVLAMLASALGMFPLKGLFSDWAWLLDAWLAILVVIVPALLIRRRRPPTALDIWPGIILLVPWLTLRFVHEHARFGFLPTGGTWDDLTALMRSLHETTRHESAPIHTTVAVRLVICALVGLLAALIDLIAVVGHRGALAGVPLLVVYTVAGAVPRKPVSWVWFAIAAVAYLILLALDADDDLRSWGRRVHAPGGGRGKTALAVSTQRIAVSAIAVAVVLPLLMPSQSRNLIANAFHGGGSGVGGFGASGGGSISPFAALKGELDREKPLRLMRVHMNVGSDTEASYLRVNVLSRYTNDKGWSVEDHGDTQKLEETDFSTQPPTGVQDSVGMEAQVTISGLTGNAPLFALPTGVSGVGSDTTWSPQDQLLLGDRVHDGQKFVERFSQPAPSVGELNQASSDVGGDLAPYLQVPDDFPQYARDVVSRLVANKTTAFQKARALNRYFTDPGNGFSYDLKTKVGDSGSALVDFLQNKTGFCQQYAAAMGIMLRVAGVPSRVVLGYMHPPADASGTFEVTTSEAHAWVEAYFTGIGWIPFDPTPAGGLIGGAKTDFAWAPHAYPSDGGSVANTAPSQGSRSVRIPTDAGGGKVSAAPDNSKDSGASAGVVWVVGVLVVLALLGCVPATTRALRRRRRYRAARHAGDADELWAELSDTATDLGYVWSSARSPRQVARWLSKDVTESEPALRRLAVAVERSRYSPEGEFGKQDGAQLAAGLHEVTAEMRSRRSGRARLRAIVWPASLGWANRWFGGRRT